MSRSLVDRSSHGHTRQFWTHTGANSRYLTRISEGAHRGKRLFGISYLLPETFLSVGAREGEIFVVFSQVSPPLPAWISRTSRATPLSLSALSASPSPCLALCAILCLPLLFFSRDFLLRLLLLSSPPSSALPSSLLALLWIS